MARRHPRPRAGTHRARPARHRRVAAAAGLALGLSLAGTQSQAFWSVTSTAGSAGGGAATTVPVGPQPQVGVADRNDVRVTWQSTGLGNGTPVTGYTVTRRDTGGVEQAATGGCSGTLTTTSCTELDVPDGLWTYRVTPRYRSWTGVAGPWSDAARTDVTPPVNEITAQVVSGGLAQDSSTPTTFYYRGVQPGSFRLVNALTDTGSGPVRSVTGALGVAQWSHQPSAVDTPTGGPFTSNLFSWSAGATAEFSFGVAGIDAYDNTAPATLDFRLDNDPPTGGAISYPNGYTTARSVTVGLGSVTDARAGVAQRILQGFRAPLSGNTCGAYAGFGELVDPPASVAYPVEPGWCYRAQHLLVDRVGNTRTVTTGSVVRARDYSATVTSTPGLVGYWRMDDASSSTTMAATRGSQGTYVGGPGRQQGGAIVGDDDRSVLFDGTDDYARVARPVSDSFSLELWFRSDGGGRGTGNNWYDGAGLVDAEVGGVQNDFGISLLADGRVAAGVGNPDRTVLSPTGLANNQWHHVVMTRNIQGGLVELWVDGTRVGTVTGSTARLIASANLDIGRLQTATNYYRGHIDEVAAYSQVLSADTIRDHWRSGLP